MSWQYLLGMVVTTVLDAWFSAAYQMLTALEPAQLEEAAEEGDEAAAALLRRLEGRERLVAASMTGATMSLMGTVTLAALWVVELVPLHRWGYFVLLALGLGWILALLGDVLPRVWAKQSHWSMASGLLLPLQVVLPLFTPALWLVDAGNRAFARVFSTRGNLDSMVTREELKELLLDSASEEVKPHERQMLRRVLDFGSLTVRDAMVPLERVTVVEASAPLREAVGLLVSAGHSRVPVVSRRGDQVLGILHASDVLYTTGLDAPVRSLLRPGRYVLPSVPLERLLKELQRTRSGLAIVVNEQGRATGIITVEDILEQIVGDIKDEFD
ncbi:MAG: CNNM domain-containing protein [Myxococcota bacterium]